MRLSELKDKRIVIWGLGREGKAAAQFLRARLPDQTFTFIDENAQADLSFLAPKDLFISEKERIPPALDNAELIIKSPGVSLYHPLLQNRKTTSLLNLWLAEPHAAKVIGVTGTKGKSTTSALLAFTLNALGQKAALIGNIGVPVTEVSVSTYDYAIVEVSSYQAANFDETCDIGVVTSLFPEHLDWHRSLQAYYRDKLNLLAHSRIKIINAAAMEMARQYGVEAALLFNQPSGFHVKDGQIFNGPTCYGVPDNGYLSRPHNLINVCAVLTVLHQLGFAPQDALAKMAGFQGLPHRQQELGIKNGVLFVDDSISTTPQSAIAAMEVYADRPLTLLVGGYDRGIDYAPLIDYLQHRPLHAVICMGVSGRRVYETLHLPNAVYVASLQEAVESARRNPPTNGVVLLSPAAPSYGMFKDFEERGRVFAELIQLA